MPASFSDASFVSSATMSVPPAGAAAGAGAGSGLRVLCGSGLGGRVDLRLLLSGFVLLLFVLSLRLLLLAALHVATHRRRGAGDDRGAGGHSDEAGTATSS